jgi:hypothetical protein
MRDDVKAEGWTNKWDGRGRWKLMRNVVKGIRAV